MKIAYLANVRFPSERAHAAQIAHMCQAFSENGAEVDLYVNKRAIKSAGEISDYFGFKINFSIINIYPKFIFPKLKFTFYINEMIFTICFLLAKKHKYDFIYCRSEWILLFLSLVIPSRKLVWESHEAKINSVAKYILLKKDIKTVVISEGIYDEYRKIGVKEKNMCVAHDGIDDSFFSELETKEQARKRLGLSSDKKIIMYIGGLDKWKGVDTFFEASELCTEFKWIAIGGNKLEINQYKEKYPRVLFLGQKPYKDLKHNQQVADVLVLPNTAKNDLSAKYTSPLKLFSYMSSGVPVVASDITSVTSVAGNKNLSLFGADNAESLCNKVRLIMNDYDKYLARATFLRKEAKKYTWLKRVNKIISFLA